MVSVSRGNASTDRAAYAIAADVYRLRQLVRGCLCHSGPPTCAKQGTRVMAHRPTTNGVITRSVQPPNLPISRTPCSNPYETRCLTGADVYETRCLTGADVGRDRRRQGSGSQGRLLGRGHARTAKLTLFHGMGSRLPELAFIPCRNGVNGVPRRFGRQANGPAGGDPNVRACGR